MSSSNKISRHFNNNNFFFFSGIIFDCDLWNIKFDKKKRGEAKKYLFLVDLIKYFSVCWVMREDWWLGDRRWLSHLAVLTIFEWAAKVEKNLPKKWISFYLRAKTIQCISICRYLNHLYWKKRKRGKISTFSWNLLLNFHVY